MTDAARLRILHVFRAPLVFHEHRHVLHLTKRFVPEALHVAIALFGRRITDGAALIETGWIARQRSQIRHQHVPLCTRPADRI